MGFVTVALVVLLNMAFTSSGFAESISDRSAKIIAGWDKWVSRYRVKQASISVSYDGKIVAEKGKGRTPQTPAPIASVSKSITGLCIAKLVGLGKLDFDSPLNAIVPILKTDVKLSQLLTHTSGFKTDITQRPIKNYPGTDKEYLEEISTKEIERGRKEASKKYRYNNANYAMLGAAISKVTGKTYEQACADLVLKPAGIKSPILNPEWRVMSSWGGWKLSAIEVSKFLNTYFSKSGVMGKSPHEFPSVSLGSGAYYGMGYLFRIGRAGGYNIWHDGRWHTNYNGKKHRFGALFASWDNGWSVSTNHNISGIKGEHGKLDKLLSVAAHN